MDRLTSNASSILFVLAVAFAGLAVVEKLANLTGYSLVLLVGFTPSRLLELAAVALLFVIAIQLREPRQGASAATDG